VVEACLIPSEQTNHAVQALHMTILEEARLLCQPVLFDEPANELEAIRRRTQSRGLLASQVAVVRQTNGKETTFLAAVDCSWPFRVLGSLPEILDRVAKSGTVGGPKLGGNCFYRAPCFLSCLSNGSALLLASVICWRASRMVQMVTTKPKTLTAKPTMLAKFPSVPSWKVIPRATAPSRRNTPVTRPFQVNSQSIIVDAHCS
jgi:hypothetical protein